LRIKGHKGYFIYNNKVTGEEANKLLKEMKSSLNFPWQYDPYGFITETRLKNKSSPYTHVPRPEIEKFMNQTQWEENT